jgi:hypothetical protein
MYKVLELWVVCVRIFQCIPSNEIAVASPQQTTRYAHSLQIGKTRKGVCSI